MENSPTKTDAGRSSGASLKSPTYRSDDHTSRFGRRSTMIS